MLIYFYVQTKNYNSLKMFSKLLLTYFFKNNVKNVKYSPLKKKKTIFSLLKSPHVNKTAQEQFEFKYSKRKLVISSVNFFKTLLIFKKIYSAIFFDIKIKTVCSFGGRNKSILFINVNKGKLFELDCLGDKICSSNIV